jgi:hypothetical protein
MTTLALLQIVNQLGQYLIVKAEFASSDHLRFTAVNDNGIEIR